MNIKDIFTKHFWTNPNNEAKYLLVSNILLTISFILFFIPVGYNRPILQNYIGEFISLFEHMLESTNEFIFTLTLLHMMLILFLIIYHTLLLRKNSKKPRYLMSLFISMALVPHYLLLVTVYTNFGMDANYLVITINTIILLSVFLINVLLIRRLDEIPDKNEEFMIRSRLRYINVIVGFMVLTRVVNNIN